MWVFIWCSCEYFLIVAVFLCNECGVGSTGTGSWSSVFVFLPVGPSQSSREGIYCLLSSLYCL